MKNLLAKAMDNMGRYRSLISFYLVAVLANVPGFANVNDLINNKAMEIRTQTFYYRSVRANSGSGQVNLIDTGLNITDGVTNLQAGAIPKDQVFAVRAIALRYSKNASSTTAQASLYSNAIYDNVNTYSAAPGSSTTFTNYAQRLPIALLNADIEIKCGTDIILERQTAKRFFSERSIVNNNTSDSMYEDAIELAEPAYLTGGQAISVTIFFPNGSSALGQYDNIEVEFFGVGTGRK
jgi:hypothetical protein